MENIYTIRVEIYLRRAALSKTNENSDDEKKTKEKWRREESRTESKERKKMKTIMRRPKWGCRAMTMITWHELLFLSPRFGFVFGRLFILSFFLLFRLMGFFFVFVCLCIEITDAFNSHVQQTTDRNDWASEWVSEQNQQQWLHINCQLFSICFRIFKPL